MRSNLLLGVVIVVCCIISTIPAYAGPPFLTDDPEPVPYGHWEFYTFESSTSGNAGTSVTGPAIEVNKGVARDTQLHLVLGDAWAYGGGNPTEQGLGDIEAGVKYRFLHQSANTPDAGIFPLVELPTGDASRGLGNGRTWFKLPLWMQETEGSWTTYWGGGYAVNPAPGQLDYWYGGWLVQKDLSPRLTLGTEVFAQGAQTTDTRSSILWNAGGYYNFTSDFSLLFSGGHSFQGQGQTVTYLALYWTWGPGGNR